jgi:flagellin
MTAEINGLRRATQNINDGISVVQLADGAAGQLTENYQRMRELAVQAANDTNSKADRQSIQQEVNALVASNVDMVDGARLNNQRLLDGSFRASYRWARIPARSSRCGYRKPCSCPAPCAAW